MDVRDRVMKARSKLVFEMNGVYASMLMRRPMVFTKRVSSMAVDAKGVVYVNEEFADKCTDDELMFVLAHEAMHLMLLHPVRKGSRDGRVWNIAADAVINDILLQSKVGKMPLGGVMMPGASDLTTEEVYAKLMQGQQPSSQSGGSGGGPSGDQSGDGDGDGGDPLSGDVIYGDMGGDQSGDGDSEGGAEPRPMSDAEIADAERQLMVDVASAAAAIKMCGNLPAGLQRIVDEVFRVSTPWHDILERYMTERTRDDYSWTRPNRRHVYKNLYLPGMDGVGTMGRVVVGVDTSGSISQQELSYFAGHISRILEECRPEQVDVVYCDASVAGVDSYQPDDLPIHLEAKGGGGTDLRRIFDWVDESCEEVPEVVIILTDGYTPWPDQAPGYDVVVLSTTNQVGPGYARTIKFEME